MCRDPKSRPAAKEALQDPWLRGNSLERNQGQPLDATVVQRIQVRSPQPLPPPPLLAQHTVLLVDCLETAVLTLSPAWHAAYSILLYIVLDLLTLEQL